LNCNPFKNLNSPYLVSTVQEGFVTFGHAEVTDFLGRVTTAALKASWCQKWMVHRRLRPEALGGLIQRKYPLHPTLLNSPAVQSTFARTGTHLLPQAYPEGCPLHPSYPAGHAAVAGACSIVLKACFEESMLMPGCVEPDADGLSLKPCSNYAPTVGEEVDKLAFNIAMGRDWAGIHYRSDTTAGLRLGEDVAIAILQDLVGTYTEDFKGFSFTVSMEPKSTSPPKARSLNYEFLAFNARCPPDPFFRWSRKRKRGHSGLRSAVPPNEFSRRVPFFDVL
jgi:hypothetical protein